MKVVRLYIGLITISYFTGLKSLRLSLSCNLVGWNLFRKASHFKRNTWQFTALFVNKVTDSALIAAGGSSNVDNFLKRDFEF